MKKWLIALLILLLLAAGVAGVASYRLNNTYGWIASKAVHHDSLATAETRLRVAVDTLRLEQDLEPYIPDDVPLPNWLPWKLPELLPRVLPREVALLGGPDFRAGQYDFTLFVNEQRGGPALPPFLNTRTAFRQSLPGITWDEPGFTLNRRGVLTASGHLPLPFGVEQTIMELWSPEPPSDRLALLGGHVVEGVIDNRNGDIVVLIAACAPLWDTSLETLQQNSQFAAVMALLAGVLDVRVAVDFKTEDSLVIQVRANAEEDVGGQLEFFIPLVLPTMAQQVQLRYGLVMESTYAWIVAGHTYVVDVTLTGVDEKLKTYFRRIIPAPPPAAAQ